MVSEFWFFGEIGCSGGGFFVVKFDAFGRSRVGVPSFLEDFWECVWNWCVWAEF